MPSCCSSCGGATASSPTTAAGTGAPPRPATGTTWTATRRRPPQWPRGPVVARVAQRSPGTSPGAVAAGLPGPSSLQRSRRVATDRFRFDRPCVDVSRSVIRNGWCQGVAARAGASRGDQSVRETDFTDDLLVSCSSTPPGQRSRWPGRGRGGLSGPVARCVYRQCRHRQRRPPRLHQELTRRQRSRGPAGRVCHLRTRGRHTPASPPASPCPGCGNSSRSCSSWSMDPSGTASACCVRCAAPAGAARPPT